MTGREQRQLGRPAGIDLPETVKNAAKLLRVARQSLERRRGEAVRHSAVRLPVHSAV